MEKNHRQKSKPETSVSEVKGFLGYKDVRDLTPEEIAALPWNPGEEYALVNRENRDIRFASDSREWLQGQLIRMTPKHPEYPKLQLVERVNK